ncbi:MAG: UDP-N-acetylmuramoyl-L-alanine--D-glutamate ligase, partial [Gammaproteobacteria bacterium]
MTVASMNATGPVQTSSRGAKAAARVLVVGLGKTGIACTRHLRDRYGVAIEAVDSRQSPPGLAQFEREFPDVPIRLGSFERRWFERAATVVLSPGVSADEPALRLALDAGVPVIGEIELFARAALAPVAAITGSNGKSTVTSLLGLMATTAGRNAAVGGNLGTPALELLPPAHLNGEISPNILEARPRRDDPKAAQPDCYVVELSSFQLETTYSLNAAVAAVLNVSPDHLDRHGTFEAYASAKQRVYRGTGVMVINLDDPVVMAMRDRARAAIGFSVEPRAENAPGWDRGARVFEGPVYGLAQREQHDGALWLARWSHGQCTPLIPLETLPLPGRHNAANALAALAMGSVLDLDEPAMLAGLSGYKGLAHRCQLIAAHAGVRWYNDSKGTNVGATRAALEGIGAEARVVLIAGGEGKGADFTPLALPLARYGRLAIVFGRDAGAIETAVAGSVPVRRAHDLQSAVHLAREAAERGDAILF